MHSLKNIFWNNLERNLTEKRFAEYSSVYPCATENLGYYDYFDFQGKNVLTVSGSGDHILAAYLKGAKRVVAFDLNYLAGFFSELKFVCLKQMEYEEFLDFFLYFQKRKTNKNALKYSEYLKIKDRLSGKTREFFDKLYVHFNYDGLKIRQSHFFRNENKASAFFIRNSYYLGSRQSYQKTQQSIQEKEFLWFQTDIIDLVRRLKSFYRIAQIDLVLFSDIANYADLMFKNNPLEEFCKKCVNPIKKYVAPCGTICIAYIYNFDFLKKFTRDFRPSINFLSKRKNAFGSSKGYNYSEITFPGVKQKLEDTIVLISKN